MLFDKNIIQESKESFLNLFPEELDWGIVLGSGLSEASGYFEKKEEIPFSKIKHLKEPSIEGHQNKFCICRFDNKNILVMQGRLHLYEGLSPFEVSLPIALMGELGIKKLILTNAAGGLLPSLKIGDIMAITDHINLQGANPLIGISNSSKFIDMNDVYSKIYINELKKRFAIKTGVYAGILGPNYETPAEIRFLKKIGASAVGMSTVMEAIIAKYYQMEIFGFSVITNMTAGIQKKLSHKGVVETGKKAAKKLGEIIKLAVS